MNSSLIMHNNTDRYGELINSTPVSKIKRISYGQTLQASVGITMPATMAGR